MLGQSIEALAVRAKPAQGFLSVSSRLVSARSRSPDCKQQVLDRVLLCTLTHCQLAVRCGHSRGYHLVDEELFELFEGEW